MSGELFYLPKALLLLGRRHGSAENIQTHPRRISAISLGTPEEVPNSPRTQHTAGVTDSFMFSLGHRPRSTIHYGVLEAALYDDDAALSSSPINMDPVPSPCCELTFSHHWRMCRARPNMTMLNQPIIVMGKVYVSGVSSNQPMIQVYTPRLDQWTELPSPPVKDFTIATLRGQLLVVGGRDKSTDMVSDTILTFNDWRSQQWIASHPAMPTALTTPAVIGYQDHLIVAGGYNSEGGRMQDVNILDVRSNEWITAKPLPKLLPNCVYCGPCTMLIEDTLYVIGHPGSTLVREHVPTLISIAKSAAKVNTFVWERLPSVKPDCSSLFVMEGKLFAIGGNEERRPWEPPTTSIHVLDPNTNCWSKAGKLPKRMSNSFPIHLSGELFLFGRNNTIVHVAEVKCQVAK